MAGLGKVWGVLTSCRWVNVASSTTAWTSLETSVPSLRSTCGYRVGRDSLKLVLPVVNGGRRSIAAPGGCQHLSVVDAVKLTVPFDESLNAISDGRLGSESSYLLETLHIGVRCGNVTRLDR